MNLSTIKAMVKALQPVLTDKAKAECILARFWRHRIALVWTTQDVHRAANDIDVAVTEAEARAVLHYLHDHHNPQYGLEWKDLQERIRDEVLGRKLTKRELNRFLKQDILAKA